VNEQAGDLSSTNGKCGAGILINKYLTLSRLWKTNEFLQVMIALAIGPVIHPVSIGFIEI
jgi:hypothetical protein